MVRSCSNPVRPARRSRVNQALPLHPWVWPEPPWQRSHINLMGPFNGQILLLLVNACSKWPDSWDFVHDHQSHYCSATKCLQPMDCLNKLYQTKDHSLHRKNLQISCTPMASHMLRLPLTTLHAMGQWKDSSKTSSRQ